MTNQKLVRCIDINEDIEQIKRNLKQLNKLLSGDYTKHGFKLKSELNTWDNECISINSSFGVNMLKLYLKILEDKLALLEAEFKAL